MSSYGKSVSSGIVQSCWHAEAKLDGINEKMHGFLTPTVTDRSIEKVQSTFKTFANPLFPFPERLPGVFSAPGEKANS